MREIKLFVFLVFLVLPFQTLKSETIIMSSCDDKQDSFLKNEYILNLDELIMIRNYIYTEKTYQKYKITDLSVKKNNSYVRNIYKENGKIFTYKHGYPQFYTQLLFERDQPNIKIKTVINNEPAVSFLSKCDKIEVFNSES